MSDEMDCKIFIDAPVDASEIATPIAEILSCSAARSSVATEWGDVHVARNSDFDAARRADFPDGFLDFPRPRRARVDLPKDRAHLPMARVALSVARRLRDRGAVHRPAHG
jgi:hypothetical protein